MTKMNAIVIVDTSIFLNILNVEGFNQDRDSVYTEVASWSEARASLLLPMAAIFETGKHIAQLNDGRQRRRHAENFVLMVRQALDGNALWQPIQPPTVAEVRSWIDGFAEAATMELSMADLSIIE